MSKNQLAPIRTDEFENYFTQKELDIVVNSIAKNATNEELALFIQICKNNGLDPFKNHIYFIKYGNQMSIQVSVEGIQYLAQQRDDYRGVTTQLVHENDDIEFAVDENTQEVRVVKHGIKFPRGKVAACYAIARREGFPDKLVIIEREEVEHLSKKSGSQWNTYFNDMFKKHVLKRALKAQFGIDVDDQDQQEIEPYQPRQRVDITPEDNKSISVNEGEVIDADDALAKTWAEIQNIVNDRGVSKEDLKDYIQEKFQKKSKELTLQEVVALKKMLDYDFPKQKPAAEEMSFDDFEGMELE
ncbi:recombinase RecT [Sutcliffiella horikoshii]|uniref:Recombinase RecT n=1 Tax=Sutcliffiella horikoshii TaxID=79883 RepID=A0A5D4SZF6_9BACI|nr:RecT family recombinase [Sutcliffiella horikoshii]TYS68683.1 recombinase RecT [Sutcliffiella horikoshii]